MYYWEDQIKNWNGLEKAVRMANMVGNLTQRVHMEKLRVHGG
jgi:hypothetical protein